MSQQSLKKLHAHHGLPIWRYADLSQRNWYAGWSYLRYFLNCYHRTPETISTLYLFIYLFIFKITFLNPYLEMRNSGLLFFYVLNVLQANKKKNNMWFIGILICFKPAKLTEFPRQPLRVKAHQRKKMKKKKKKSFMSREEHSQLRLKLPLGAARRKWVCPRCSVSVPVVLSNSYWSKRAEIKPMLEASLLIMRFMNRPRVCVALES